MSYTAGELLLFGVIIFGPAIIGLFLLISKKKTVPKKIIGIIFIAVTILLIYLARIYIAPSVITPPPAKNFSVDRVVTDEMIVEHMKEFTQYTKKYPNEMRTPIHLLGTYEKTGLVLVARYSCSDVCPQQGGINIYYRDIKTPDECLEAGGLDVYDPAWGGYRGCFPNANLMGSWFDCRISKYNRTNCIDYYENYCINNSCNRVLKECKESFKCDYINGTCTYCECEWCFE